MCVWGGGGGGGGRRGDKFCSFWTVGFSEAGTALRRNTFPFERSIFRGWGASGAASSCFLVIQLPRDNVEEENVSIMNCLGVQYHLRFPLDYAAMLQRRFNVTLDVDRKMSAC